MELNPTHAVVRDGDHVVVLAHDQKQADTLHVGVPRKCANEDWMYVCALAPRSGKGKE